MTPQIIEEYVFLVVLVNYSVPFLIRLLEQVQLLDILHKSQTDFLANDRTADHVFTLPPLIDKYVNSSNESIHVHVLWTLAKHLIRSGTMDFYTSFYKSISEETSIM